MVKRPGGAALISLIYFIFGFLWIFFSDRLLFNLVSDENTYAMLQTWKGWIYVLITTVLIYLLLRTYISGKNRAIRNLEEKERQLEHSLAEKEVLINELHHRVKNNLQMISSLINLNKTYNENDVRLLLDKIEDQLFVLSALHERVFNDNQSLSVDIMDYIGGLVWGAKRKYGLQVNILLEDNYVPVLIPADIAVPIGIIISEGLSEMSIQAVKKNIGDIIEIEFKKSSAIYKLSMTSQSRSLDPEKDSLSLNLIRILAEQLRSELVLSGHGEEFRISISIPAI